MKCSRFIVAALVALIMIAGGAALAGQVCWYHTYGATCQSASGVRGDIYTRTQQVSVAGGQDAGLGVGPTGVVIDYVGPSPVIFVNGTREIVINVSKSLTPTSTTSGTATAYVSGSAHGVPLAATGANLRWSTSIAEVPSASVVGVPVGTTGVTIDYSGPSARICVGGLCKYVP